LNPEDGAGLMAQVIEEFIYSPNFKRSHITRQYLHQKLMQRQPYLLSIVFP